MSAQRDVFLTELLKYAREDKKIVLLSSDMGAPALDIWRKELPDQVFQTGIAEQNTINFGAGLSAQGYNVYVYTMGAWAARCFEQMRYSCAMANLPITFLANGVGFGYVPSGPAHEPTEDIAYMRSLIGVEIISPLNNNAVKDIVGLTVSSRKFRYIRLERSYDKSLDEFYGPTSTIPLDSGMANIKLGNSLCLISSGYMMHKTLQVRKLLEERNKLQAGVIDLWRIKPIDHTIFFNNVFPYNKIVTIEEQSLSGGFGSAVCEVVCDLQLPKKILRLGIPERYIFENGTREEVLEMCGLSVEHIYQRVESFYNKF